MKQQKTSTRFAKELLDQTAVHSALSDPYRLRTVELLRQSDRTPSEISAALGIGSNLLSHHVGQLKSANIVKEVTSAGDQRRRYLKLNEETLAGLDARLTLDAEHVLFVCTENTARSQLAAALYETCTGKLAASAGTHPRARVHPRALQTARRHGLNLQDARPRGLTEIQFEPDLIITVCDQANEELRGGKIKRFHWSTPDPVTAGYELAFEECFWTLKNRVVRLIT